jgi:hypothetical protein
MQKFHKGDHVRVAKDLGPGMSHFTSDCEAIVMGSYEDQYGGRRDQGDNTQYTLHLKGRGESSWYYQHQLTLIAKKQMKLLKQWEAEEEAEEKQQSDLDWIFANGKAVLESASGATVSALAACMGITDLWGPRGEGITYYMRSMFVLAHAKPYLTSGDKAGWLKFCETVKKK